MKKLGAMLVAGVLCLGMTMTAFAAGSPSSTVTATVDGKEVPVTKVEKTEESYKAAESYIKVEANVPEGKTATVVEVVDVDASAAGKEITLTVTANDINVGDTVMLLHWDGTSWDYVATKTVGEGNKVLATFDNLSPVAIVKLMPKSDTSTTNPPADNNKPADTNKNDGKSPATGEAGMAGLFTVVALCGAALVLVNRKKVA